MKKKVPCSYKDCGARRIHWEEPNTPRGTQHIDVAVDYEGLAYCSMDCAILDGHLKINNNEKAVD